MSPRFTYVDSRGDTQLKSWTLPLIVAGICVPVAAAFAVQNAALGLAVGAAAAVIIVAAAVRSRPFGAMEVAKSAGGHRVLVLATIELDRSSTERIAELAAGADDVRVLVPIPIHALDRWMSAEDDARELASDRLARSAGELTAAGLQVSGSVGDSDPIQAVEDELRSFAAAEILVVAGTGDEEEAEKLRTRVSLPLTRIPAG